MRVSLNIVRQYTTLELTNDELIDRIGSQLGAVEEVIEMSKHYIGALIVKVIEVHPHPDADRLKVCRIDDGGVNKEVKRDGAGYIQVVCGAPNVSEGLLAVWLPPGATIPSTYASEPVILDERELRGVVSRGMLASPKELVISDDHSGLLVVDSSVAVGSKLSDVYELNDTIIDIENKMFTHRPDCFGQLGVAREIAGITHKAFISPQWYLKPQDELKSSGELKLEIRNELHDVVPRFSAQIIKGVSVKPSPILMQSYLTRLGVRPINNIVDETNYYMLLTGQPLHAYDYDKVVAQDKGADHATIVVRYPFKGESEKLELLNGKTIQPHEKAILIATNDRPIGLGGVMGGASTEVDKNTKNIILESASFDMYSIRKTAMTHGLFTDAVTRFTKGQSPLQTEKVLSRAATAITADAGGVSVATYDDKIDFLQPFTVLALPSFINERLGLDLSGAEMAELLRNVEFSVDLNSDLLKLIPPFWRTDIQIQEDVVEEVGRLYGFSRLPLRLPMRDLTPGSSDPLLGFKRQMREILSRGGANEVLTYTFVHGQLMEKTGQDPKNAFQLSNAISPDLQYYRTSLLPSLLEKVRPNIKNGFNEFCLFELNKVHSKDVKDEHEPDLPAEQSRLAIVCAVEDKLAKHTYSGAPFYLARHYLDYLLAELGLAYEVQHYVQAPVSSTDVESLKPFEPIRTGMVVINNEVVAAVGEPKAAIKRALKLPNYTSMLELDLDALLRLLKPKLSYKKLSHYPRVEQDICLRVEAGISYQDLYLLLEKELESINGQKASFKIEPVDIFQRPDDDQHKQVTFHITISSYERTLTSSEVNEMLIKLGEAANKKFGAEVI